MNFPRPGNAPCTRAFLGKSVDRAARSECGGCKPRGGESHAPAPEKSGRPSILAEGYTSNRPGRTGVTTVILDQGTPGPEGDRGTNGQSRGGADSDAQGYGHPVLKHPRESVPTQNRQWRQEPVQFRPAAPFSPHPPQGVS